jgi:tetratricopeptide (TPR) repeat protein
MSKCYQASHGQLRCITCHVIHNPPTQTNKVAYYRERCLTCHTNGSCKLPLEERERQEPANDCVGCHMPKKPVAGIPHSDDTNHRIVRRAGQPLPDIAFEQPTPDLPGLLCIDKPQEEASNPIPPLTKLLAYGEVVVQNPDLRPYYLEVLEQLSKSAPNEPLVLGALGHKALTEKDYGRAADYLSRALQAGEEYPTTFLYLGEALLRAGRVEEAARFLERGVAVWPYAAQIQKSLIVSYVTMKDYARAQQALQRYVELFPGDTFMREMLEKVEGYEP